jgi:hypothetical protein
MLGFIATPAAHSATNDVTVLPPLVSSLMHMTGQIVTLTTERTVKYLKGVTVAETTKRSTFQCRIGAAYDNLAVVLAKRENGELPSENAGLNGMRWVSFPHLLQGVKSGKFQIRCTTLRSGVPSVTFIRNGVEISRAVAMVGTLASEQSIDERPDVFNVSIESITEVNRNVVVSYR